MKYLDVIFEGLTNKIVKGYDICNFKIDKIDNNLYYELKNYKNYANNNIELEKIKNKKNDVIFSAVFDNNEHLDEYNNIYLDKLELIAEEIEEEIEEELL